LREIRAKIWDQDGAVSGEQNWHSHESNISKLSFFSPTQAGSAAIAKAKERDARRMRNIRRRRILESLNNFLQDEKT